MDVLEAAVILQVQAHDGLSWPQVLLVKTAGRDAVLQQVLSFSLIILGLQQSEGILVPRAIALAKQQAIRTPPPALYLAAAARAMSSASYLARKKQIYLVMQSLRAISIHVSRCLLIDLTPCPDLQLSRK